MPELNVAPGATGGLGLKLTAISADDIIIAPDVERIRHHDDDHDGRETRAVKASFQLAT